MLTRHFPPAVSGGARRPYLLSAALAKAGAEIFVVAPDRPKLVPGAAAPHPHRDPAPDTDPLQPARRSLRDVARLWLRWPDPDIVWARRCAAVALETCPFTPDWIITSSPPESMHVAGAFLKRRYRAPWLADMRDTWMDRPFFTIRRKPLRRMIERPLARRILGQADLVTAVTTPVAIEARRYTRAPVHVLGHFLPAPRLGARLAPECAVHLVYTGSFSLSDPGQRIEAVLQPFAAARRARPELHLHIAGRLTSAEVNAAQQTAGVDVHGLLGFEQSLELQGRADALALTGAPDAPTPGGKLAEYLALGKPVISFGEGSWRNFVPDGERDPVAAMLALVPGEKRAGLGDQFDADAAAAMVLAWMAAR